LLLPRPLSSTLFPYTTLFRSFVPVEFDHHELSCFISADALTIFLHEVTVGCESFEAVRQLNDCSFIIAARNCSVVHGADCECILDRKSTRLNSSHVKISYAVF